MAVEKLQHSWQQLQSTRREVQQIKEGFTGSLLKDELLAYFLICLASRIYNQSPTKEIIPSITNDGPVGAGNTTQAGMWERYFNFWAASMGGNFRNFSLVARDNGYTPQDVIKAASQGQLHFAISESEGHKMFEIASSVPGKEFAQTIRNGSVEHLIRTPEISAYASDLNKDPLKWVEALVVRVISQFAVANGGVVIEGRNTATTFNAQLPDTQKIRSFYFGVSEKEAIRRAKLRLRALMLNKQGREPTAAEYETEAQNVIARNAKDVETGVLMTPEAALTSGDYAAVFNTDLAGPRTLFAATIALHSVVFEHMIARNLTRYIIQSPRATLRRVIKEGLRDISVSVIAYGINSYSIDGQQFIQYPRQKLRS